MLPRLIDKLHYPVGRLGWKLAARAGLPLRVGVVVQRDEKEISPTTANLAILLTPLSKMRV